MWPVPHVAQRLRTEAKGDGHRAGPRDRRVAVTLLFPCGMAKLAIAREAGHAIALVEGRAALYAAIASMDGQVLS